MSPSKDLLERLLMGIKEDEDLNLLPFLCYHSLSPSGLIPWQFRFPGMIREELLRHPLQLMEGKNGIKIYLSQSGYTNIQEGKEKGKKS